jgi:hypothetical protein
MKFYEHKLSSKHKKYCLEHAKKMAEGFKTYSFKNDEHQSIDVYQIGKIGEFVFYKFLRECEDKNLIKISHTPFRENYEKLNYNDDFIFEIDENKFQVEVRTKGRSVSPESHFECCTDCIKPHLIYVFLSYNKESEIVSLVGYADWDNLSKYAKAVSKGTTNNNFQHKVNEFNIEIKHLYDIHELIDRLKYPHKER